MNKIGKILFGAVIAAAAVLVLFILVIITVVVGRIAVNNSYTAKAEKIYRKEKESFQIILDNMQQLHCEDGIYFNIEWDSSDNKAICDRLRYLREKYKDKSEVPKHLSEEYNPVFGGVHGEYDEKGLVYIDIPVYYRKLNTQGDYDNPDKVLYYISFCRLCSEGSCGSHDYYEPCEEGWFVKSKKGYAG